MSIDFEIPEDAKAVRERVRQWVHDECIPAEERLAAGADYKSLLKELRAKARAQGLWLPFIPLADGGMGLGPLANALVQMELGESHLGAHRGHSPCGRQPAALHFMYVIEQARIPVAVQ